MCIYHQSWRSFPDMTAEEQDQLLNAAMDTTQEQAEAGNNTPPHIPLTPSNSAREGKDKISHSKSSREPSPGPLSGGQSSGEGKPNYSMFWGGCQGGY